MKTHHIQTGMNNELLRKKSKKVGAFNNDIKKFEKTLIGFMKEKDGVGIAAPQIGESLQMIICKLDSKKATTMCNPEIIFFSEEKSFAEEGCLSLPGVWGKVERSKEVICKYQDIKGKSIQLKLSGFSARVVQHEKDHLDGILFADKAIELKADEGVDLEELGL
ncbi:peptide deformylase [Candidatus Peregrinibacteria bacterium]|jgi:peptide deformylase|nr:peptide deformylase [Candidatus Peregrinibacteria bacterium]